MFNAHEKTSFANHSKLLSIRGGLRAALLAVSAAGLLVACGGGAKGSASASSPSKSNKAELTATAQQFYDLLSDPTTAEADARTQPFMAEDWLSTPTPLGGPGRAGFVKTLGAFGQLIPDLRWDVQEMIVADNRVVVRSVATGTPQGPFFGVEPATGRSFEIMTIDIHTIEDGKIVKSYHVEDWATAVAQLKGQEIAALDNDAGSFAKSSDAPEAPVKQFYAMLSDATAADGDARTQGFMADGWNSTPTPFGGPGREGFVRSVAGFGQLIPDLAWDVKEMLTVGNRVIVRSVATGTPAGPFMGVDPATGNSFEIMTIDIHTVEDGKMVRSFHVEDWATAIAQLHGQDH